jgi:hypothetical protein
MEDAIVMAFSANGDEEEKMEEDDDVAVADDVF